MNRSGDPRRSRKAVLLGGAHGTLALARCLERTGFDVWLVADETSSACFSRAVRGVIRWPGAEDPGALQALEQIAREHSLEGSLLFPSADPEVRLVSQARDSLASLFDVMVPGWDSLRWACDKSLAYRQARDIGLGVPRVYERASLADPALANLDYPLVLKPGMRLRPNRFTADRGWRVDDADTFRHRYAQACALVGAEQVVVQQLVPGGGEQQLSYAGLWDSGRPVVSLTARRLRQYPVEFGQTSTYVETAELPQVTQAAETFLRSIAHHGLVEIEFKHDARDGVLKLLDVNPRPWNWLGLAAAAGVDFGEAIEALSRGRACPAMRARSGVVWIFASRDVAAALASGRLRPRAVPVYAASWARVRSFACWSWTDPVPALVDIPLSLSRSLRRRASRVARTAEGVRHARN